MPALSRRTCRAPRAPAGRSTTCLFPLLSLRHSSTCTCMSDWSPLLLPLPPARGSALGMLCGPAWPSGCFPRSAAAPCPRYGQRPAYCERDGASDTASAWSMGCGARPQRCGCRANIHPGHIVDGGPIVARLPARTSSSATCFGFRLHGANARHDRSAPRPMTSSGHGALQGIHRIRDGPNSRPLALSIMSSL